MVFEGNQDDTSTVGGGGRGGRGGEGGPIQTAMLRNLCSFNVEVR